MLKRIVAVAGLLVLAGSVPAFAQDSKVEVSATIGWAFSDGVSADTPVLAPDGNIYDRVDPKDSFLWGLTGGVNVTENAEVGFMWTQQMSSLLVGGTNERDLGDMTVSTYHGYFAYNFFPSDSTVRPFLLIGLGATDFGDVDATLLGADRTIKGASQFSSTWAAGVKAFPNPRVGFRGQMRWTPTYIKTDAAGWWCDPFWGCYLVGNAQYSNQFTFEGGVTFRF
jgi:hypothetical protein